MNALIFSYGTLQQPDVQQSTFGRLLNGQRDRLRRFEKTSVKSGNTQHANVTFNGNENSRVDGMVFEISDGELARVDAYEADFSYKRIAAVLESGRRAWVYVHEPVVDLAQQPEKTLEDAAKLLVEEFDPSYGWPTLDLAREEVRGVIAEGFARAMIENDFLLGWIGGVPEYQGRVWELHPLVVHREHRRRGIGRTLVEAFESEARTRGAHTVTLGTDDTSGMTSLSEVDLYADIPGQIRGLRDRGKHHPFLFYQKLGYVVTGVMPDANGPGKPDIYMSKRVSR
jgi:aminoglycoside 6'-N-acetyltransferase I